jgi:taurine dioxygenase
VSGRGARRTTTPARSVKTTIGRCHTACQPAAHRWCWFPLLRRLWFAGPLRQGVTRLFDAISPELPDRLDGEMVIYAMDVVLDNLRFGRPDGFVEIQSSPQAAGVMAEFEHRPRAIHPAVWTRPSGEKVLHVSPWMAKGLEGRDDATAEQLLTEVCDEIVEAAKGLSYFHRWTPTDMVIWDNLRVLHSVSGSEPEDGRCMHRTTIAGDYGLGRFEEPTPALG